MRKHINFAIAAATLVGLALVFWFKASVVNMSADVGRRQKVDLSSNPYLSVRGTVSSSQRGKGGASRDPPRTVFRSHAGERVGDVYVATAGLVHLSTPTRRELSRSLPCRPNHGHVAAAKLFGIEEVPTVRTSHFSEADTSGILGHLRAVRSAYAVGNPMGKAARSRFRSRSMGRPGCVDRGGWFMLKWRANRWQSALRPRLTWRAAAQRAQRVWRISSKGQPSKLSGKSRPWGIKEPQLPRPREPPARRKLVGGRLSDPSRADARDVPGH